MKEWLIKIQDNIYYDSEERVYRYKMHCPNCDKQSERCQCYTDLDRLLSDIDDGIADYTCSSKCALLIGDFDELGEAMQIAMQIVGLERDVKTALKELSEEQRIERIKEYSLEGVLLNLFRHDSKIPIDHLKNPSPEEQLEILLVMGDAEDILWNYGIDIYPKIEDLTEEQASQVLTILTEDADFDYPGGDECIV